MNLRAWRTDKGLTLEQLGERIGRSAVAVSRYERGDRVPDRETMGRIVAETGGAVQPNDFYGAAPAAEETAA